MSSGKYLRMVWQRYMRIGRLRRMVDGRLLRFIRNVIGKQLKFLRRKLNGVRVLIALFALVSMWNVGLSRNDVIRNLSLLVITCFPLMRTLLNMLISGLMIQLFWWRSVRQLIRVILMVFYAYMIGSLVLIILRIRHLRWWRLIGRHLLAWLLVKFD